MRTRRGIVAAGGIAILAATGVVASSVATSAAHQPPRPPGNHSGSTTTPIKHLVVLFDENISYDHYFGTYPLAANTDGVTFHASPRTPVNNNLITSGLLTNNPNELPPTRLTPSQLLTCDQNHNYGPEQLAEDNGAMDQVVQNTSTDASCATSTQVGLDGLAMDYYDGNTVTALWNYAQQYSLSDNSFDANFGPSAPGAINLISGNTHGFQEVDSVTNQPVPNPSDDFVTYEPDSNGIGTVTNDPDPAFDDCADTNHTSTNTLAAAAPGQKNIGDLLNAKGVTWGWFQGGFAPTTTAADSPTGYAVCGATHDNVGGVSVVDYSAHHNPFEYYASTSNPHHLPPRSLAEVGHNGQANHQYDLSWFDTAARTNHLPAVSFVKAAEYQDGHASYSDPIDEQHFLVHTINELEKSPEWSSTAVVIAYDDSDGWYDHVAATITNGSTGSQDAPLCSSVPATQSDGQVGRCGPGPRLPLLVISPYAKTNFIDNTQTEQTSITKFIEQNWRTGTIGDGSFDTRAGSLLNMLSFAHPNNKRVILRSDGTVASITPIRGHQRFGKPRFGLPIWLQGKLHHSTPVHKPSHKPVTRGSSHRPAAHKAVHVAHRR